MIDENEGQVQQLEAGESVGRGQLVARDSWDREGLGSRDRWRQYTNGATGQPGQGRAGGREKLGHSWSRVS